MKMKSLSALILAVSVVVSQVHPSDKWEGHNKPAGNSYEQPQNQAAAINNLNKAPSAPSDSESIKKKEQHKISPKWLWTFFGWVWNDHNANPLIAVMTVLLAFWGAIQIWLSIRASRFQLRAYVFMEKKTGRLPLDKFDPEKRVIHTSIYFKNFGQTPAYKSIFLIDSAYGEKENPKNLSVHKLMGKRLLHMGTETIPPNGYVMSASRFDITKDEIPKMRRFLNEDMAFYVFGTCIYMDAFGRWWRSDIRMKHQKVNGQISWFTCSQGNQEKRYQWYKRAFLWFWLKIFPVK